MKAFRFALLAALILCFLAACDRDNTAPPTSALEGGDPSMAPTWSWDTAEWMFEYDLEDDGTYGLDLTGHNIEASDYVPRLGLFPKVHLYLNDSTQQGEYMSHSSHWLLDLDGVNSRTHEFVFKMEEDNEYDFYRKGGLEGHGDSTGFIILYSQTQDRLWFKLKSRNSIECFSTTPIELDEWYVINVVFDFPNDSVITYVNGDYFSAHGLWFPDKSYASDYPIVLGRIGGRLDEYWIFDRALQATEIGRRYDLRFMSPPAQK